MVARSAYAFLVENPGGKRHFEEGSVDGRIILNWILKGWACGQD
jgi:hypothetical protein